MQWIELSRHALNEREKVKFRTLAIFPELRIRRAALTLEGRTKLASSHIKQKDSGRVR